MAITAEFLEIVALAATKSPGIAMLPWPTPGNSGGLRREHAIQKANKKGRVPYKNEMERAEQPSFFDLLKFMVDHDDLTDDKLPIYHRAGAGSVIAGLTGDVKPGLSGIRNRMAHGHPFDTLPWAGLLEVVRDLIEYAYRDWPGEVAAAVMSGDVGIDFLDEFQGQYSGPDFGFEIG